MLNAWKTPSSHEDLFIERYERLLDWSLKLTGYDQQLAEDLVHDSFVQFTLSGPDLDKIGHLDSYLFAVVRNTYLSHIRREPHIRNLSLSVIDFDSAEVGLRSIDPREQINVQNSLRAVCRYACTRKDTSKAGSVLLLRFFHGYYPSEIAMILRANRLAVEKWLQIARNEARTYLENPSSLSFIREPQQAEPQSSEVTISSGDLLSDLRAEIFGRTRGECIGADRLRELYLSYESATVPGDDLAHIVSCAACLDGVNRLLNLPPIAERYPVDMAKKETRGRKGPGGGPGGPSGSSASVSAARKCLRRMKETFEHRPKELRIAVNGYVQVSQKISSDVSEQTLSLDLSDQISFIEVFSEQWVRLFLMNVEPLPSGGFEQESRVELSEGRNLTARLTFYGPCPQLQVIYHDPEQLELQAESIAEISEVELLTGYMAQTELSPRTGMVAEVAVEAGDIDAAIARAGKGGAPGALAAAKERLFSWFTFSLLLRPGSITALLTVGILIAALLLRGTPSVSAGELLQKSIGAERGALSAPDQVLHRTVQLEEHRSASPDAGELLTRRRIETWQRGGAKAEARRVYDERSQLVSGEWTDPDGSRQVYSAGGKLHQEIKPSDDNVAVFDRIRNSALSAQDFTKLIGPDRRLTVEERPSAYVLSFAESRSASSNQQGVLSAALVLTRPDLHATEETILMRQGAEVRQFRFTELSYERRPVSAVPPAVFQPDPLLLTRNVRKAESIGAAEVAEVPVASPAAPVTASPELELDVLNGLDRAGALLGEQITLSRTPESTLLVQGIVETQERKNQILKSLGPVIRSPAVKVDVQTVAEAEQHQRADGRAAKDRVAVRNLEVNQDEMPVESDLRAYFQGKKGMSASEAEREAGRLSSDIFQRSLHARLQALAIKQVAERFSPADLEAMDSEARSKWKAMVIGHAREFDREVALIRKELEPIFPHAGIVPAFDSLSTERQLAVSAEKLFELAVANDEALRRSFAASADGSGSAPVRTDRFWASLADSQRLANGIIEALSK